MSCPICQQKKPDCDCVVPNYSTGVLRYLVSEKWVQAQASYLEQERLDAARWRYVRDHSIRGCQDTKTTWSWHFTPRGFATSMEALVDIHMEKEKENEAPEDCISELKEKIKQLEWEVNILKMTGRIGKDSST